MQTNHLNGTSVTGDVDTGEGGTANVLSIDVTQYHDYYVTIEAGGAGTHRVHVYVDGSGTAAAVLDVTAGSGDDYGGSGISYLAMGAGSTGASGALDVDFVRVAAGVYPPEVSEVPSLSAVGLALLATALLAAGMLVLRRTHRPTAARA